MRATSLLAWTTLTLVCSAIAVWTGCGSDEDASTSSDGDGGASSSSGSSGNASADGGIDPPDAGPGGDTTKIACGATTCAIPAQTCCVTEVGRGGDRAYSCASGGGDAGACPRPDGGGEVAALECSGAANCPSGQVCCVSSSRGGASSECKASCGRDEAQLCDPAAADAGGCPRGEPCSNDNINDWGNLPRTFGTCGGRGN